MSVAFATLIRKLIIKINKPHDDTDALQWHHAAVCSINLMRDALSNLLESPRSRRT